MQLGLRSPFENRFYLVLYLRQLKNIVIKIYIYDSVYFQESFVWNFFVLFFLFFLRIAQHIYQLCSSAA